MVKIYSIFRGVGRKSDFWWPLHPGSWTSDVAKESSKLDVRLRFQSESGTGGIAKQPAKPSLQFKIWVRAKGFSSLLFTPFHFFWNGQSGQRLLVSSLNLSAVIYILYWYNKQSRVGLGESEHVAAFGGNFPCPSFRIVSLLNKRCTKICLDQSTVRQDFAGAAWKQIDEAQATSRCAFASEGV